MVHHYETAICGTVVESCAHYWTVAHVSICSMTMHYLVAMANVGGVTLAMLHLGAVAYSLARCSTVCAARLHAQRHQHCQCGDCGDDNFSFHDYISFVPGRPGRQRGKLNIYFFVS